MKITLILLCFVIISCSSEEEQTGFGNQESKVTGKSESLKITELTFVEYQDSLRELLLNFKNNNILKSSILKELYIRGLVNQVDDKVKFYLPFNLHGLDCGSSDCYSTDIIFEFPMKDPIEFPKYISFKIFEHGCIDVEKNEQGSFKLVEQSGNYINYYSEKHKSNLIIIDDKRKLYYFPNSNSIKVDSIDKIFKTENVVSSIPFQSTIMTLNEYEFFLKQ